MILRTLLGFQFKSDSYGRAELETAMIKAVEMANEDLESAPEPVKLEHSFVDLRSGVAVMEQIRRWIEETDICVFDVTHRNANVFFEAGIASALSKPVILIHASTSHLDMPLPSDMSGLFTLSYENTRNLIPQLAKELEQAALLRLADGKDPTLSRLAWGGSGEGPIYVISGELLEPSFPSHVNRVAYIQSPDLAAVVDAALTLASSHPSRSIRFMTAGLFHGSDYRHDLVCVGGPRSNSVTAELLSRLDLPLEFVTTPEHSADPASKYLRNSTTKEEVRASVQDDDVRSDVAVFVRANNPFDDRYRISVVSGLYTFGVYAASRMLSSHDDSGVSRSNLMTIHGTGWQSFQVVKAVDVVRGEVVIPRISTGDVHVVS